jgi:ribonuclease BN (tRNA processing enzyme)
MRDRPIPRFVSLSIPLLCWLSLALTDAFLPHAIAQNCGEKGIAVQVLGSGGPELQDKRASSSYLVWQDGQARVLIDAGGGSALRFGESGAKMSQLDVMLFSHLHVDHSADFPSLMFSSWFEERKRPSPISSLCAFAALREIFSVFLSAVIFPNCELPRSTARTEIH